MRVIYLTLAIFIALGMGAACRTPPVAVLDCDPAEPAADCPDPRVRRVD